MKRLTAARQLTMSGQSSKDLVTSKPRLQPIFLESAQQMVKLARHVHCTTVSPKNPWITHADARGALSISPRAWLTRKEDENVCFS
jgi:hypothetical protein